MYRLSHAALKRCPLRLAFEMKQHPVWIDRHERFLHKDELKAILEGILGKRTSEERDTILTQHGVPCGPILGVPEVLAHSQITERGFVKSCDSGTGDIRVGGIGFQLSSESLDPSGPPPDLGQYNAEMYEALGYRAEDLAALRADGVI